MEIKFLALVRTAAATCIALAAAHASAAPIWNYGYTGSIQSWVAPTTGIYRITATGAQGGHGTVDNASYVGGLGAQIIGSFNFNASDSFWLAVGGMGSSLPSQYNGGGGGTFFVDSAGNPLLVAGGGGGIRAYAQRNGFDASITPFAIEGTGSNPNGIPVTKATDLGQGGVVSAGSYGSAGAGFYSNGASDSPLGTGGESWANGLNGGAGNYSSGCNSFGGFGGGGSGSGCGGGGGGGGYSGGDGGFVAGGGGSWNTGFDQLAFAGMGYGNGSLVIEEISSVPEPGTIALFGLGFLGLSRTKKRKEKRKQ